MAVEVSFLVSAANGRRRTSRRSTLSPSSFVRPQVRWKPISVSVSARIMIVRGVSHSCSVQLSPSLFLLTTSAVIQPIGKNAPLIHADTHEEDVDVDQRER